MIRSFSNERRIFAGCRLTSEDTRQWIWYVEHVLVRSNLCRSRQTAWQAKDNVTWMLNLTRWVTCLIQAGLKSPYPPAKWLGVDRQPPWAEKSVPSSNQILNTKQKFWGLHRNQGRSRENFLTLIFFSENSTIERCWVSDVRNVKILGGHRLRFEENMPGRTPKSE